MLSLSMVSLTIGQTCKFFVILLLLIDDLLCIFFHLLLALPCSLLLFALLVSGLLSGFFGGSLGFSIGLVFGLLVFASQIIAMADELLFMTTLIF